MWLFLTLACWGSTTDDDTVPTDDTQPVVDTALPAVEVVALETRDGVALEADYYGARASSPGTIGLVLVHMIPPSWDRTSWPTDFIQRLRDRNWQVIAFDRRGAGNSGGVATEAYQGEKGRYDVEAADAFLRNKGVERMVVIGASNGTTSALDFILWSLEEESLSTPEAVVFMTGGGYTENNTNLGDLALPAAMFTYSTAERDWSVGQQEHDPGSWLFKEYPNGDHGTKMFAAEPTVQSDIEGYLVGALGL
jgi:pimeloyl-ACP methyl ester carboxylesterase